MPGAAVFDTRMKQPDDLIAAWRTFIREVAHPKNREIAAVLQALFPTEYLRPPVVRDVLIYVEKYDALFQLWDMGEMLDRHHVGMNWPTGLDTLVSNLRAYDGTTIDVNECVALIGQYLDADTADSVHEARELVQHIRVAVQQGAPISDEMKHLHCTQIIRPEWDHHPVRS